jgi:hypothetical protein
MAVTRDQIIGAAEQLNADGVYPSIKAVREKLGGGSDSTISPVLRDWRINREKTKNTLLEMPPKIKQVFDKAGAQLWQTAAAMAGTDLQQCREQIRTLETERDAALAELEKYRLKIANLDEKLKDQGEQILRLEKHVANASRAEGRLQGEMKEKHEQIEIARKDAERERDRRREVEYLNVEYQKEIAELDAALRLLRVQVKPRDESDPFGVEAFLSEDRDTPDSQELEKSIIKYVTGLVERGLTYPQISQKLNDDRYHVPGGKRYWTWQLVQKYHKMGANPHRNSA